MYPLLLCSVLTFAFGLERAYHFTRAATKREFLSEVLSLLRQGEYGRAAEAARTSTGPLAAVAAEALEHRGRERTAAEEAVSLTGSAELKRLSRHLHLLELIGRIAPLIGLLGTVLGMVEAFRTVSGTKGAVDASLLAGGIWEALITTVAGLCVAIPALVLHHLFEDRIKTIAFQMKHGGTEIVNLLGGKG